MSATAAFPALEKLMQRELERFREEHPRSAELSERAKRSLLGGVPMHWMVRWAGGFPVFAAEAEGARFRDVDGHEYVDFCLGDTGAMTGHAPPAAVRALAGQAARGITGRRKVLVFNWCYHGTVDETFATLQPGGEVTVRDGSVGPPVHPSET